MPAILQRRVSPTAPWARRLGAFSVVLFLTSALSHRFRLLETVPFLWLLGLCFLLAVAGLLVSALAFSQMWKRGVGGLSEAAVGALLSLLLLVPYGVSAYHYFTKPPLADISTDPTRPPPLQFAMSARLPPMNPVTSAAQETISLQRRAYEGLSGRLYEQPRENVVENVLRLMRDRGWQIVSPARRAETEDGENIVLNAVAYSYLLGFPSDVSVRIEDRGESTYVDMRSASRYGRHDLGENATRIERFMRDLDARMQAPADP
ncbi:MULTISPECIES: DUF1499 domain-containing protein [Chelativorans]|jgi:uncharacterized protein (DUF1499 family)|uniref:DUF1499 domain-containing protein n=1 Tax=Chelativorans sp. (strain BNC1) TaxID=266779 RepID=Q11KA1_CHESB|nr:MULTISPECIES: DUF1499 domain-containing protein [Chelativorans]